MFCPYWLFNYGFEFQISGCNGGHNLKIVFLNLSDTSIINVKNVDYRRIFYDINKSKAIHL